MNILVTGGAGFIGSHIADRYVGEDHEVTVVDDLSVGKREWVPDEADFRKMDVTDGEDVMELFREKNFDLVNHHAAHNDSMDSLENPQHDARVNIVGSINVLEAARENDVERIIYASSGGLSYGEPQEIPTDEDHEMNPSYPYGISKHSFEHYLELYENLYGIEFLVLRYASVYGPRATGGVIKNFLEAVNSGEKPVIFGDGSQTRDFIHVNDVVEANQLALEKGSGFYNIGTREETSINELWKLVARITGSDEEPEHRERWLGDIDRCQLDYSKAEEELDWEPRVKLENGIEKLWNRT
ncbi:MAG: NAD-dependent epimerase/dehydratase family protein [Candidatus Nanohaloarchaea archaeon]